MSLSPSSSPRGRNLVSTLVESIISPTSFHSRTLSYGRVATDEDMERAASSLEGGERTSPLRVTVNVDDRFCIDDGDEGNNDSAGGSDRGRSRLATRQIRGHLPELPSLIPSDHIPNPPANYICPLTLQLMEDPVQDSCGHTFERRAILEWLDRSSGNGNSNSNSSSIHHRAAVCPISRKPLTPLPCSGIPVEHNDNNNSNNNSNNNKITTKGSHSCYDRVLKRNEGLQHRIQEWKLHYPLYQGVDAGYAEYQRETMLTHNTISITNTTTSTTTNSNNNNNNNILSASIDCPYGDGETVDDCDSSRHASEGDRSKQHHRLSRFELLLLPQEREVRKILKERSRDEVHRLIRWRRWRLLVSIVLAILLLVAVLYTVLRRGRVE